MTKLVCSAIGKICATYTVNSRHRNSAIKSNQVYLKHGKTTVGLSHVANNSLQLSQALNTSLCFYNVLLSRGFSLC